MDCGEKVVSVIYTDDGLYLGMSLQYKQHSKILEISSQTDTKKEIISFLAGGLMNGQIRLFNAANGNHITFLQTPEIEQDR